ncbi:fimbrial protein [Morganella morganii]|uniref:fimbrial protein n=1 Tax=Morganella morganii TaxID=582 RepID=UPI0009B8E28E|nr:fimbrial protein [Morganella morganii]
MKITLFIQKICIILIVLSSGFVSSKSIANGCVPDSKSPQIFRPYFSYSLKDPSDNQSGTKIDNAYIWSLGGTYSVTCTPIDAPGTVHFTALAPNLTSGISIGDLHYFHVNKYLQVSTEIFIGGSRYEYLPVPFNDESNLRETKGSINLPFDSGSRGRVNLYFTRPFVGEVIIPPTEIATLYGSFPGKGQLGDIPLSRIFLSGKVIVPQSCNINAGNIITIDLGNIGASSITRKGMPPEGYNYRDLNITMKCNNISDGVDVTLSLSGSISISEPNMLESSNKDIGIHITDSNGNTLKPNESNLPVLMDYPSQTGSALMRLSPVNTTGKLPESGSFQSLLILNAEIN